MLLLPPMPVRIGGNGTTGFSTRRGKGTVADALSYSEVVGIRAGPRAMSSMIICLLLLLLLLSYYHIIIIMIYIYIYIYIHVNINITIIIDLRFLVVRTPAVRLGRKQ